MVKLFEHQKRALQATKHRNKVAYYLDMGLGKTFVCSEKMKELDSRINLLICQKSKIDDWYEHFKSLYSEYKVMKYSKQDIPSEGKIILIINYDLAWRREKLKGLEDFTLMLDESSLIKNISSKRTKFILKLNFKNVILLSGTPVGGKYEELYSQIRLLGWNISKKLFYQNYIVTRKIDICGFKVEKVVGYKNIENLKSKLRKHGAIFMKTDEVFTLPEIREIEIKIKPIKEYKHFKKHRLIEIDGKEIVGDTALTAMLGERQLASMYNQHKYDELKAILESTENRVIIFYNFTHEVQKIVDLCNKLEKPISIVNGKQRNLNNYEEHSNSITLIQYQAGAMGLNLQKSNIMIYFSLPLSSDLFEQSKKRIHRIGQKNNCIYYRLITDGSIDEKIYQTLLQRKDFTDRLFMEVD
ncbi:DEAD/DEAH box helicase [Clostridium botulinum]|uniref:SNF2-related protein n=1 Tax=Clostridium botulinum TaxID=1491 RepID=UPI0006AC768B|nr:DEAD/DEAH box helicase [Clostridium botulinum]KOR63507.1 helicase SNF2 [Clostridium botulinum]